LLSTAKFQVFTAVLLKIRILCDVKARGSQRSEGSYCLHIQGPALPEECDDTTAHWRCWNISWTLQSETSGL